MIWFTVCLVPRSNTLSADASRAHLPFYLPICRLTVRFLVLEDSGSQE